MNEQLVWAGPAFTSESVTEHAHLSPAAVWWNSKLVTALAELGQSSRIVSHIPEPYWPRGAPRVSGSREVVGGSSGQAVGYWNVPMVRNVSLFRSYHKQAKVSLPTDARALVTFNPYPWGLALGTAIVRKSGCPWVTIFADRVSNSRAYDRFKKHSLKFSTKSLFLSWHDFSNALESGRQPSLHLDGGVEVRRWAEPFSAPSRPIALYTGALSSFGGVDALIRSMQFLDPAIQVVVCGKGSSEVLARATASESLAGRLRVLGMVDDATLDRLSREATCFVNPRPANGASQHNFPSKVLRYLGYGQPIASTRTDGLSPDYERALTFADSDAPEDIASCIENAVNLTSDANAARSRREFVSRRTWEAQARRFLSFLGPQ